MSYIEREPLLEILNGLYNHHLTMCNYAADGATKDCIEAVIEAPTADVVEVVRCKDCKLRDTEDCPMMVWDVSGELMGDNQDNDYCSYGERSENGT